jgi:hypothetical protein
MKHLTKISPLALGLVVSLMTHMFPHSFTYTLFGAASVDDNYYYVVDDLTLKTEGEDYLCIESPGVCVIGSILDPDEGGRIPKIGATVITTGLYYQVSP